MYLFGDRNPRIVALLQEQSFQHLVHELFAAERPGLPAVPSVWEEAALLDLLEVDGATYRAGRRLVVIPAAAEQGTAEHLDSALARYVEIAGEVSAELRAAYGQTSAAERFPWSQVSHTLQCGLFFDLAMGLEVLRSGLVSRKAIGDSVVWAFQSVSAENAYGISAVPAAPPYRALFAELWHHKTRGAGTRVSRPLAGTLSRIARGEDAGFDVKEILYLKHLKLVRAVGPSLEIQIPTFGPPDTQQLLTPLTEGARLLVRGAILPALELLEGHPWWQERVRQDAYRHAAIRLILEYGIDRVISAGVCAPFPEAQDVSFGWGKWLWEESEGQTTLLPHLASSMDDGAQP